MTDRVPFTITYNPALRNTQDILRKKKPILHSKERLRNIFKEVPVVPFRHLPNLHDLLVHAKLQKHRQDMQVPCWHFPLQFQSRCLTRPYIKHKTSHYL